MTSPYLSTLDVAHYLRFLRPDGSVNQRAAWLWIVRHIPPERQIKRGRAVLIHKDDLDAALTTKAGRT